MKITKYVLVFFKIDQDQFRFLWRHMMYADHEVSLAKPI
jgi:hypothetical protein